MEFEYTGEVDENNKACGEGIAKGKSASYSDVEGTWLHNKMHGIRMVSETKFSEYLHGEAYGKSSAFNCGPNRNAIRN